MRSRFLPTVILAAATAACTYAQRQPGQQPGAQPGEKKPTGPTEAVLGQPFPDFEAEGWTNAEGDPRIEQYRGQILVILFFRTDDPSVEFLSVLNDFHRDNVEAGIRVFGLTNQKKNDAEGVVKGKEVKFIVGYGVDTEKRYDVSSPPQLYVIDTQGVFVKRFHPGEDLKDKVEAQKRATPPEGSDMKTLENLYTRAQKARQDKQLGKAYTLVERLGKRVESGSTFGERVAALKKEIEEDARKWLQEAKDAAAGSSRDTAYRILATLSVRFKGTDIGADADTEIGRLMADREARPKIREALDNAQGEVLIEQAEDLEASRRFLEARKLYRQVTEDFIKTEAAKKAEEAIDRINSDPQAQEIMSRRLADEEADRWLDIADLAAKVEMYNLAREYYQTIIDKHPETRAAPKARERLAKLPEEAPPEEPIEPIPD